MSTSTRRRSLTPAYVAGAVALGASLLSISAATSTAGAVEVRSEPTLSLSVVAADAYLGQNSALPVSWGKAWTVYPIAKVKVTGARPGDTIEARYDQPASMHSDVFREVVVQADGTVRVGAGRQYPSLAEATERFPAYRTPMVVEVRLNASDAPAAVEVTSFTEHGPLFFRNVKMTTKGKSITFTGKVVDSSGKPRAGVTVYPSHFSDYRSETLPGKNVPAVTNGSGGFSVTATRGKRGPVGLRGEVVFKTGSPAWYFSRLFNYAA